VRRLKKRGGKLGRWEDETGNWEKEKIEKGEHGKLRKWENVKRGTWEAEELRNREKGKMGSREDGNIRNGKI
jgi:hypothetical protein